MSDRNQKPYQRASAKVFLQRAAPSGLRLIWTSDVNQPVGVNQRCSQYLRDYPHRKNSRFIRHSFFESGWLWILGCIIVPLPWNHSAYVETIHSKFTTFGS